MHKRRRIISLSQAASPRLAAGHNNNNSKQKKDASKKDDLGLRVPVSHLLFQGILLLNRLSAPPDLGHPRAGSIPFRATVDMLWYQNAYGKIPGELIV